MNTWHEDYAQGVRMGEFSCPNTTAVMSWTPIAERPDPPLPYAADRWILWGVLGACVVGFLSLLMWRVW